MSVRQCTCSQLRFKGGSPVVTLRFLRVCVTIPPQTHRLMTKACKHDIAPVTCSERILASGSLRPMPMVIYYLFITFCVYIPISRYFVTLAKMCSLLLILYTFYPYKIIAYYLILKVLLFINPLVDCFIITHLLVAIRLFIYTCEAN